ncbi:MAG: hypothetical protein P8N02_11770 [Actinomycetota bacterium]|nr:hypothetical protein [Actinomycetota bacterium]
MHILGASGDALVAIALAGSLFFNLDPAAARPKVALYLLLTIAPFALVGPLIGPLIDRARGGRRGMVLVSAVGRAVLAALMIRHLDSLFLFPEAFGALVLGKTYHVAKSALVPGLVKEKADLVEANSKLALLSGVGASLAAGPGLLLSWLGGSPWVLGASTLVFLWQVPFAARVPRTTVAAEPPDAAERSELRGAGIVMAASAMSVLRGMTGFTLFLIAFWLRTADAPTSWFGGMIVASSVGQLSGAIAAPHLRRAIREEHLLGGVLGLSSLVALLVAFPADRVSVLLFALTIGLAAGLGKLSFDAIVQRDAPDANQGRSFARFETRFQLTWVLGAIVPVVAPNGILPIRAGLIMLGVAAGLACFLYLGGLFAVSRGRRTPSQIIASRVWTAKRYEQVRARLPDRMGAALPPPASNGDPTVE